MRVAIIAVFTDFHRRGRPHRGALQPQIGPLIAALLPPDAEVDVVNDTWVDPDWSRDYDLVFLSALHPDFDRARQISHWYRRRGAKTVFGGTLASTYPAMCAPFFDAIATGDPETVVPAIVADFARGRLAPLYRGGRADPSATPTPRLDLAARHALVPLALEATRGCPFTCAFCALNVTESRFAARPVDCVLRDLREGSRRIAPHVPRWRRRFAVFQDNNLGGSPQYLREFCAAIAPLRLHWAACVTFNVIARPDLVRALVDAGCAAVFVGLESLNEATLVDMSKRQNVAARTRAVLDDCRDAGLLVMAGMMVSPLLDDVAAIDALPDQVDAVGLVMPEFVSFETPIPGTPFFRRLATAPEPAFVPNALLRDFTGYTLTVEPRRATRTAFVDAWVRVQRTLYGRRRRLRKLAHDLPTLLARGAWSAALIETGDVAIAAFDPAPTRTFVAGTDTPPPERVPFTDADFASEAERNAILAPWPVTDAAGRVLPMWLADRPVASGADARAGVVTTA